MGYKSDYITDDQARAIMCQLNWHNRLVCELMYETGFRIGDAVAVTRDAVERARETSWLTIYEEKTGKKRSVRLKKEFCERLLAGAGGLFIFEHRSDPARHRHRTTVWKQVKKAADNEQIRVSPHSFRKNYAVRKFRDTADIDRVRRDMGHENINTTILYATSDVLTAAKLAKCDRKRNHRRVSGW